MNFYTYKIVKLFVFLIFSIISILFSNIIECSICTEDINSNYLIDAWGNAFHSHHKKEGLFCHSCSRIISEKITNGGYVYSDGRKMCSLCKTTAINNQSDIISSYKSVIKQLSNVGIINFGNNIPIKLINLNQLNSIDINHSHNKLKGITKIVKTSNLENEFYISILSGLPKIEFEAVLAHELMHVWININNIKLSKEVEEGFCNLGSFIIYNNNQTNFSKIHIKAMEMNKDKTYGYEYRKLKNTLKQQGWKKLIQSLKN